ncbi:hypothetical protein D3C75_1281300 [compost metagenome]
MPESPARKIITVLPMPHKVVRTTDGMTLSSEYNQPLVGRCSRLNSELIRPRSGLSSHIQIMADATAGTMLGR